MSTTAAAGPSGHQEVWELLPWHANGTLAADEAERVETHLARCALCRRELEVCREMASTVRVAGGLPLADAAAAPSETALDRTPSPAAAAAGEAAAGGPASGARPVAAPGGDEPARPGARPGWWAATPPVARRAVLVQAAALALVALALAFLAGRGAVGGAAGTDPGASAASPAPAAFRTLAQPAAGAPAAGGEAPTVRLVLHDAATVGGLNDLLSEVGGRIVAGPSPAGVYTVRLALPDEAAPGDAAETLAAAVERLRRHPAVVFAEPAVVRAVPGGEAGAGR